MILLLIPSLIWAVSFGLIKGTLTGVPPATAALIRLAVALAVFTPFLRIRALPRADIVKLTLTGAVQYGLMYILYMHSFRYLQASEAALFTVFTPIYVTALHDLLERRFCARPLGAVALAVAGGIIIEYRQLSSPALWQGFALMQGANLCFAFGQIFYRHTMARAETAANGRQVFALLYLGAVLAVAPAALSAGPDWTCLTLKQAVTLLYLGAIASGLGFFLWNSGARRVGAGTLASFNNMKIPLGILISVLFFGETADWPRLVAGGLLIAGALLIHEKRTRRAAEL